MKSFYTEHKILVGTILLLFIFSLLCQILIGFLYQNMIKETYNMSSTKNKMLKKCKLKFTNRYELHEKVVNIPVFVDKFIHSIKFGPFSVRGLQHFSGQMLLLSVFVTGIDSRADLYAPEFNKDPNDEEDVGRDIFSDALNIAGIAYNYVDAFDTYGVTHIISFSNSKLVMLLGQDDDYVKLYDDDTFTIFERLVENEASNEQK